MNKKFLLDFFKINLDFFISKFIDVYKRAFIIEDFLDEVKY